MSPTDKIMRQEHAYWSCIPVHYVVVVDQSLHCTKERDRGGDMLGRMSLPRMIGDVRVRSWDGVPLEFRGHRCSQEWVGDSSWGSHSWSPNDHCKPPEQGFGQKKYINLAQVFRTIRNVLGHLGAIFIPSAPPMATPMSGAQHYCSSFAIKAFS